MLKLGFESSAILESKLRDGLYRMAFRWFALPPRWSFSGSKATLAREIQILIDTRHTIKGDTPVLRSLPSQMPAGATWNTNGSNPSTGLTTRGSNSSLVSGSGSNASATGNMHPASSAPSHSRGHSILHLHKRHSSIKSPAPLAGMSAAALSESTSVTSLTEDDADREMILSVPREQLKQRAQRNQTLLLMLIENEICRMATWANPTDQKIGYLPDVTRFARDKVLTDVGWQNLVVDAWVADPRLAVQLTQRFSNPAVRRELKSLICKFPGELVHEPDALPLLIEQLR
ncbi:phosphatidylinositol-4- kinase, partial [Linderina pennispora]